MEAGACGSTGGDSSLGANGLANCAERKNFHSRITFQKLLLQTQAKINAISTIFHAGFIACAFHGLFCAGKFLSHEKNIFWVVDKKS
jgi:hypothetical protein